MFKVWKTARTLKRTVKVDDLFRIKGSTKIYKVLAVEPKGVVLAIDPQNANEALAALLVMMREGLPFARWGELARVAVRWAPSDSVSEALKEATSA